MEVPDDSQAAAESGQLALEAHGEGQSHDEVFGELESWRAGEQWRSNFQVPSSVCRTVVCTVQSPAIPGETMERGYQLLVESK